MTIETEAPPAAPADMFTNHHARAEWEAKLVEHFSGRTSSDPHGNVAQFNADMRSAGMQTSPTGEVDIDQTAMKFLTEWRQQHPHPTTAQLTVWERDLAQILEGRRMHESPQQFAARKASAAPAASPAAPAAEDEPVYVQPSEVPVERLHGYTLPDIPPGVSVDPASLGDHLAAARAAGISESQVQHVVRLLASQAAAQAK